MAKHMAKTCGEEARRSTEGGGLVEGQASQRTARWPYLNNADHDHAHPRGEKVFLKQVPQHRQAALRTEGRSGGAAMKAPSFTAAFTISTLYGGSGVLQGSRQQEGGMLFPQSVTLSTPQQPS